MTKLKSFTIPKKEITDDKGHVQEINLGNHEEKEIQSIITNSFICDKMALNGLKVQKVKIFVNKDTEERYLEKKTELKNLVPGRMPAETYAFSFFPTFAIDKIAREGGVKIGNMKKSILGYAGKGVHLFRYADVCALDAKLNTNHYAKEVYGNTIWTTASRSTSDMNACLVIFKVLMGRCQTVTVNGKENEIDPSPLHDIHIPDQKPVPEEKPIIMKRDKSLIYLYEYDMNTLSLVLYPRSIYPYAVIYYTKSATLSFKSSLTNTAYNNAFNVKKSATIPPTQTSLPSKDKITKPSSSSNKMFADKATYSTLNYGSPNIILTNPDPPIGTKLDVLEGKGKRGTESVDSSSRHYNPHVPPTKERGNKSLNNFEESLTTTHIKGLDNPLLHSHIGDLRPNPSMIRFLPPPPPSSSNLLPNNLTNYPAFMTPPLPPSHYIQTMKERHLLPYPPNLYETSLENKHIRGVDRDKVNLYPGTEARPNLLPYHHDDNIHQESLSSNMELSPNLFTGSDERKINLTIIEKCNNLLLSLGLDHEVDFFNFVFSIMLKLLSTFVEKFEEQDDKQAVDKTITLMIEYMSVFNSDTSTPGNHILRGELQNIIEDLVENFRSSCNNPNESNSPIKKSLINHIKVENGISEKNVFSYLNASHIKSPKSELSDNLKEDGTFKKEFSSDCKGNFLYSSEEKHVNDNKINSSVQTNRHTKRIDPRLEKRLLSSIQELNKVEDGSSPLHVGGDIRCENLENLLPKMDIDERVQLNNQSDGESSQLNSIKRKDSSDEENYSSDKKCKKLRSSKPNPCGDLTDIPCTFHGRALITQEDVPFIIPLIGKTRYVYLKGKRMCYQDPRCHNEGYTRNVVDGENKFHRQITDFVEGYYQAPVPRFEECSPSLSLNSSPASANERSFLLGFPGSPNEHHNSNSPSSNIVKSHPNETIKGELDAERELPFKAKIADRRSRCKTKPPNVPTTAPTDSNTPIHLTLNNPPIGDALNPEKIENVETTRPTLSSADSSTKLDEVLEQHKKIKIENEDGKIDGEAEAVEPQNINSCQGVVQSENIQASPNIVSLMSPEFVASAIKPISSISFGPENGTLEISKGSDEIKSADGIGQGAGVMTKISEASVEGSTVKPTSNINIECIELDDS